MATETPVVERPKRKRTAATKAKGTPPAQTGYVVLESVPAQRVQLANDEVAPLEVWAPVAELLDARTKDAGWQVKVFTAASKVAAIRQHTGDGADIVEGTFRAVPVSSWKGGITTKRVTAAERLPID